MSADERLEEIRVALSHLQEELLGLPEDAFVDRLELKQRQAALRDEARRLAALSTSADPETAQRERLERLRRELDRRMDGRLSHAAAAQTGRGGGIDPALVHDMNRQMDEAMGIEQLRTEIADLERRIAAMDPGEE